MSILKVGINLHLSVYGDGEPEYRKKLIQQVKDLRLDEQVAFYGHVTGEQKATAYLDTDVCVVPSFTENFGMVVAESLAHGVPVIASKGSPWQSLVEKNCGLWVDNSPESLALALKEISERNLEEMGINGRAWMQVDYSWNNIAENMHSLYSRLIRDCAA